MSWKSLPVISVSVGLFLSGGVAGASDIGYPSLDPAQYYESLRVGTFNSPSYTFTGLAPGLFTAACVPGDVLETRACATLDFESQPVMSLTASITAYPFDPTLQTKFSNYTQITAEVAYFYEVHGPPSTTPIPIVLNTYVEFLSSVGTNRSYSIQGTAQTRLDGVSASGFLVATSAVSDSTRPPAATQLFTYAFPNTQYDIALIANNLTTYNNGTPGYDPAISASVFIDPVLSFAPGFDSTGYAITFSDGIGNGATPAVPEPATFGMFAGGLFLVWGCRLRGKGRHASGQFPA
jgi:hypothetical protein